ncbi:hypothetical protein WJX74_003253 [Apatococcus lobatus]|uniref:PUA domain-containing protein n=1 Tax=Apatococcus lobatus TaxID=904363 RepID=A0AAW1QKN6_9CHLO
MYRQGLRAGGAPASLWAREPWRSPRLPARCASAVPLTELPRVVLKAGKARLFSKGGHPLVYGGAVDRVVGRPTPKAGDAVVVADGADAPIAWGLFNPDSMFRVRPCTKWASLREAHLWQKPMSLPSAFTNVYRLINSEGDRLSGLVVDILNDRLIVASTAAWAERYREHLEHCLKEVTGLQHVVWRPNEALLQEEGLAYSRPSPDAPLAQASDQEAEQPVRICEGGLHFLAQPMGQKTGFYADQRDSRALVRTLAAGKHVLDLYCFTGGFALNAALGGAASVRGLDTSRPAIELARQNADLNSRESSAPEFLVDDAAAFMRREVDALATSSSKAQQPDLIILDPPKLAPNRKTLNRALHHYHRLNTLAMKLVAPGGLLMTCSCSGAVAQSNTFLPMLQEAATAAGRRITVLRMAGASPDHTLDPNCPEGSYLTNVLLAVS